MSTSDWADFAASSESGSATSGGLPGLGRHNFKIDAVEMRTFDWARLDGNPDGLCYEFSLIADGYSVPMKHLLVRAPDRKWAWDQLFRALDEPFPQSEPDWGEYIGRQVSAEVYTNDRGYSSLKKIGPPRGQTEPPAPRKPARATKAARIDAETNANKADVPF